MSDYQVLARKWRPQSFTDLVGQQHILRALSNGIEQERLHHAYLFTGTHGVGKTTIARILAKCFLCEKQISAEPCNQCSTCQAIDNGQCVDLIEIDAASKTRVEDTRDLLDNVPYAPTLCRFKIYLIDEVHMLSTHSFNALLKTLEEPPSHVKFLFATTEPHKLPATMQSRCLHFQLKPMTDSQITDRLTHILKAEEIQFEVPALRGIARSANGSMRDALSLLDQIIAYSQNNITSQTVHELLGLTDVTCLYDICCALHENNAAQIITIVNQLVEQGADCEQLLADFAELWLSIASHQLAPTAEIDCLIPTEQLAELATAFTPEETQLHYQIALHGRRDLPLAPSPRSALQMTLLRMLAFRPATPLEHPPTFTSETRPVSAPPLRSPKTQTPAATPAPTSPHPIPRTQATEKKSAPPENSATTSPPPSRVPLDETNWTQILGQLNLTGITQTVAMNCQFENWDGRDITFSIAKANAGLLTSQQEQLIQQALSQHYGQALNIQIVVNDSTTATPYKQLQQMKKAEHDKAKQSLEKDENFQTLVKGFDADVDKSSIQPIPTKVETKT